MGSMTAHPICANAVRPCSCWHKGCPLQKWLRTVSCSHATKRRCVAGTGVIDAKASLACAFAVGEGASRLFPPVQLDQEAARAALLHVVRRDPHQFDIQRSRWTLHHLREQLPDWSV